MGPPMGKGPGMPPKGKGGGGNPQQATGNPQNGYVVSGVACSAISPIAMTVIYNRTLHASEAIPMIAGCWTFGLAYLLKDYWWQNQWDSMFSNTPVNRQQP